MSAPDSIVCKPTKWFLWRAVAMMVMFAVGAFFFFKDWKFGYPEKNVQRFYYLAFEKAESAFQGHLERGGTSAEWEAFAAEQRIFIPVATSEDKIEEPVKVVPEGTDLETRWPEALRNYERYRAAYEKESTMAIPAAWKEFSNSGGRKWKEEVKDKLKNESTIKEQLYIGILCSVLFLGALVILLRVMSRKMVVDREGFAPAGGKMIPFSAMKVIDKRKWDTKGLAYITYEDSGREKKAKVDGMVYGQFKKEEGEPAQKLFDRIMENFRGEVIELAQDEEDEAEEESGNDDSEE